MIRTGIPVSTWEAEGDAVIYTAFELLAPADPGGGVDLDDPSSIPEAWR